MLIYICDGFHDLHTLRQIQYLNAISIDIHEYIQYTERVLFLAPLICTVMSWAEPSTNVPIRGWGDKSNPLPFQSVLRVSKESPSNVPSLV